MGKAIIGANIDEGARDGIIAAARPVLGKRGSMTKLIELFGNLCGEGVPSDVADGTLEMKLIFVPKKDNKPKSR